jgi:diaminopimelate decarboxylase
VFTADVLDRESLEAVLEHGIAVNCGSPDMIDQYGERNPGAGVALRVNPGFGHGHSRKTNTGGEGSKHGIWWEDIGEAVARAERHGLRVGTLHMHIGSGVDLEHLALVAGAMERCAAELGASVHTISTGGGLPVPYRPGDPRIDIGRHCAVWDAARKRLEERLGHPLRLEIEPGRYLVAEAGYTTSAAHSPAV